MAAVGAVLAFVGGAPTFIDPATLPVPTSLSGMAAALTSTNAVIIALTQRVAALEGKADPCVALAGTLPVATLQVGTTAVPVAVPGLFVTDRVTVQPVSDLPPGLVLAWAHPAAAGVLTVALDAVAVLSIKAPVPLLVTALR